MSRRFAWIAIVALDLVAQPVQAEPPLVTRVHTSGTDSITEVTRINICVFNC
jgi:hypothetical protein